MDCNMPVMDGLETTKEIRKLLKECKQEQITIIALTAYVTDNFKNKCMNAGMD